MTAPTAGATPDERPAAALPPACIVAFVLCLSLFVVAQYGRLGHPLLWQDEGETAMFGRRILDTGYPKVHGDEGVVYGMSVPMAFAVDEESDAYTGSLWGQYYVAALGVALSDLADGDHARTALARLPFALAGSLGLWLLWRAYAPCFGDRRRRCLMACAYLLGLASSVSLLLHVREVRYYALVVALVGVLVWLHRRPAGLARAIGTGLALFALFNVFYPAAVAVAAWVVLESLWPLERLRRVGSLRRVERLRWVERLRPVGSRDARAQPVWPALALEWAPLAVAALALIPIVLWFRMIPLSELMSARYRFGLADYGVNLLVVTRHLAQHELLLAAGLLRVGAWQIGRRGPGRPEAPALWRLVLVQVLIGARNPIFFERYFVALGPLLLLAALLDFDRVRRGLEAGAADAGRRVRALGALAGVCIVGALALKAPELAGRAGELVTPVRGPLDVAVPWVRERFEGTVRPTVATNYEAEVWMFYLGGPVVGRFHAEGDAAALAEAAVEPDVVVPRRGYPHSVERLRVYLKPGAFERHALEIADLPYNTIPELSRGRVVTVTHPFRTVLPNHPGEALEVWVRRPAGDGS